MLDHANMPADKDQVLLVFAKGPQYNVYPREREDVEVIFVPGEEWPNCRACGMPVASDRSQVSGGGG